MSVQKKYQPEVGPEFNPTNPGRIRTARALFSFAVDGGAIGLITPTTNELIPDNAVILETYINSIVAALSLGSATIAVGTSAGSAANSLLTATGKASFSIDAVQVGVPNTTPFKMTAGGYITLTVATAALTAGIIEVIVQYYVASA